MLASIHLSENEISLWISNKDFQTEDFHHQLAQTESQKKRQTESSACLLKCKAPPSLENKFDPDPCGKPGIPEVSQSVVWIDRKVLVRIKRVRIGTYSGVLRIS